MVVSVSGQSTVQSTMGVQRVLACPMRMLWVWMAGLSLRGNRLTQVYLENGC